jgi:hypothetical protein
MIERLRIEDRIDEKADIYWVLADMTDDWNITERMKLVECGTTYDGNSFRTYERAK